MSKYPSKMDKKINKKKVRKPLDEFAQIKALVRKELRRMEKRLDELEGFAGIIEQTTTKIESGVGVLLSANELKQELDRVKEPDALHGEPKEGDYVEVIGTQHESNGRAFTVKSVRGQHLGWLLSNDCWYAKANLRKLSEAEVESFKEAERAKEWEGRKSLEENDAVVCTPEQKAELLEIARNGGIGKLNDDPGPNLRWERWTSKTGLILVETSAPEEFSKVFKLNWLPFPVFKRLLIAEVERKKEEERAKPLEQWAKVSWGDTTYYVLEKSPGHRNYYTIWRPGTTNTLDIDRAELTVL